MFISEYEPDLTIEVGTNGISETNGYLNYKGSPVYRFSIGLRKGYAGQYFSFDTISNLLNEKQENIVFGSVITVIGNQSGTGTPKNKRKPGLKKLFFPNFGLNYWYAINGNKNTKDEYTTEKNNSIFRAAEGFWLPSEICKKYVPYRW